MVFLRGNKRYAFIIFIALLLSACSTPMALMPTPNIHIQNEYSEKNVPTDFRMPNMELIYVTDRKQIAGEGVRYSAGRSSSMAYGVAEVGFKDRSLDWNKLLALSNEEMRST